MARNRKTGADHLVDVASAIPWWASVLLAVVVYFVLHRLATPAPLGSWVPGQMGEPVRAAMVAALASWGQYIVPGLFLAGAVVSYFRKR